MYALYKFNNNFIAPTPIKVTANVYIDLNTYTIGVSWEVQYDLYMHACACAMVLLCLYV